MCGVGQYDWRYDTKSMMTNSMFADLKALVELAYARSGGVRVNLIGHSMGA